MHRGPAGGKRAVVPTGRISPEPAPGYGCWRGRRSEWRRSARAVVRGVRTGCGRGGDARADQRVRPQTDWTDCSLRLSIAGCFPFSKLFLFLFGVTALADYRLVCYTGLRFILVLPPALVTSSRSFQFL